MAPTYCHTCNVVLVTNTRPAYGSACRCKSNCLMLCPGCENVLLSCCHQFKQKVHPELVCQQGVPPLQCCIVKLSCSQQRAGSIVILSVPQQYWLFLALKALYAGPGVPCAHIPGAALLESAGRPAAVPAAVVHQCAAGRAAPGAPAGPQAAAAPGALGSRQAPAALLAAPPCCRPPLLCLP